MKQQILKALDSGIDASLIFENNEIIQNMKSEGIKHDADAICYIDKIEDRLILMLLVGSSLIFGKEANDWFKEYHNYSPAKYDKFIDWLTKAAIEEFNQDSGLILVIRDNNSKKWRSFKLLQGKLSNIDQIRTKAKLIK